MTQGAENPTPERLDCEVLIVGGGLNGQALGLALAGAGVETLVVDRADPAEMLAAPYDGRASAIALASKRLLAGIGAWDALEGEAQPILDIRISDGRVTGEPGGGASWLFLHYDHAEAGVEDAAEAGGAPQAMGWIVENLAIRKALHAAVARQDKLSLLAPVTLEAVARGPAEASARLADGREIAARLVVSAEGRNARLRQEAGIEVTGWDYPQAGIVCTLAHEKPHGGVAHEHFLPSGPFAVLPMVDDADGRHRSSLVWTEKKPLVETIMAMSGDDFAAEINRRFGDSLGRFELWGGRRWAYPLSLQHAHRYVDRRLALIGDAAHVIHPIAGQGLNLGLRDVAALAECIVDARRLGLDVGAGEALARYERWRRVDNLMLAAVTDGLNRLFSNDIAPLRLARDLGLAAVGRIPPAKRFFMRHAMGLVGDLPRLLKGREL
jgi:2-octaprenyl-6-methoxyphenol hydroxylase